jgi:hypothetical protein
LAHSAEQATYVAASRRLAYSALMLISVLDRFQTAQNPAAAPEFGLLPDVGGIVDITF